MAVLSPLVEHSNSNDIIHNLPDSIRSLPFRAKLIFPGLGVVFRKPTQNTAIFLFSALLASRSAAHYRDQGGLEI
jgi:hypothetical protein